MTIKEAITKGMIMLKSNNIESPKLKARLLLQYVLDKPRQYIIVYDNKEITDDKNSESDFNDKEVINEESGSITCSLYSKDVVNNYELTSTYIINYTGEFVDSVNTKEVVDSDVSSILDTLEETLNSTYSASNDAYGGYTYKITRSDNEIISDVFIDYKKMDLEQFVTDQPVLKSYMKDGKLTVEGIKSIYTSMGATCE